MHKTILITGGAGFIGSNAAEYFFKKGFNIVVIDNLSRRGSDLNLKWLKSKINLDFFKIDIRDYKSLLKVFKRYKNIDIVLHEAAQVAVTTSVKNPREDFEINALGTLNVLEAVRQCHPKAILIYASTNKVYGDLSYLKIIEKKLRYEFKDKKLKYGVNENINIDFHSPYGCSKGSADQYVRDYYRIYGLNTVVFRQSCIYGPRQFGIEDQGWVAWFIINAILGRSITIYGTGKQVRDILYIDDLLEAYSLSIQKINKAKGKIYNIGGGYKNSISLLEFINLLEKITGNKISYKFSDWRPGDQKIFISDNSLLKKDLNWEPKVNYVDGIKKLLNWVLENKTLIRKIQGRK